LPDLGARRHVAGNSVEGRPVEYVVFGDDAAAETVLLLATIHGDESAGTPLLRALIGRLEASPELLAGRRVVVVPVANPDGMAGRRRHNSRGVDLNRNFPADNRREGVARYGESALSEPESRALFELIERFEPARVVSFHQDIACVDYDGPGAKVLAERFVAAAPDLALRKLGAQPGSLGAYVGETLGIPVITVELPPDATIAKGDIWESYGPAVMAMIDDDGAGAASRPGARD
jgi:protein MpaA